MSDKLPKWKLRFSVQLAPEVGPTALGGDGVEGERGRAAVLLLECVKAERAHHAEEGCVDVARARTP